MQKVKKWISSHKKQLAITGVILLLLVISIQIIYPSNQILPSVTIDGIELGGKTKDEAVKQLDALYASQSLSLALNDQRDVTKKFSPSDIGLTVRNTERIALYEYPLLYRLIPSSLFWYSSASSFKAPRYDRDQDKAEQFISTQFGDACVINPQNATIKVDKETLNVVPAKDGGECSSEEVLKQLQSVVITPGNPSMVQVSVKITQPDVATKSAEDLAHTIERSAKDGITIKVKDTAKTLPKNELYTWLSFSVKDKKLIAVLDPKKAASYLDSTIATLVTKPAGKTVITTQDFTVVSEKKGATGVALDINKTLAGILDVMMGVKQEAATATKTLQPGVTYKRSYTKTSTGISAMLQHYGDDHPGVFGVSFMELGGGKSAQYNSSKSFITASTYKLFVAYSTLKRVDKGDWKWTDSVVSGRNLSTCFDDMIVKSDNACAEALYKKIGYKKTIDEARKLGLSGTILASDGQRTTAGDLALFLNRLYSSSIGLKAASKDRLLNAMKRNVYRSGIPAGTSGTVADKVGFLNGLLHDASIVYSPKGNYVLVIMSDGSSWANLAEITKKIESLR